MNKYSLLIILIIALTNCSSNKQEWITYKSETQGFSISFPKLPSETDQVMQSELGPITMKMTTFEPIKEDNDDNLGYNVMHIAYPENYISSTQADKLDEFFTSSLQTAVNNVHGTLTYEKIIEINGFPGREIKVSFNQNKSVFTSRIYLVYNKLYIIQVFTDSNNDFNKSIVRFLDSFETLE